MKLFFLMLCFFATPFASWQGATAAFHASPLMSATGSSLESPLHQVNQKDMAVLPTFFCVQESNGDTPLIQHSLALVSFWIHATDEVRELPAHGMFMYDLFFSLKKISSRESMGALRRRWDLRMYATEGKIDEIRARQMSRTGVTKKMSFSTVSSCLLKYCFVWCPA